MKTFFILFACFLTILVFTEAESNIFCIHGKWAHYRKGDGHFGVAQIDPFLCTHLIYTFFGIDSEANIFSRDVWLDLEENYGLGNINKLIKLKEVNSELKILAAIGGWFEGSKAFSDIADNANLRKRFVKNSLHFLQRYNFDGMYLDWQHPGHREGSRPTDREAFTLLVRDLAHALHPKHYILAALVAPEQYTAESAYKIPRLSKYLDFVILKTFDMHGFWGEKIGNNSPLYAKAWEENQELLQNINAGVFYWLERGTPSQQLIVGVAAYGRGFKMLADGNVPGSPHSGPSNPGPYTNDSGILGFNELCEKRLTENWQDFWDEEQKVPFSTREDQWIGYDNEESLRIKARFVKSFKLGGLLLNSIETDDFKGFCGRGIFPLLNAIIAALNETSVDSAQGDRKVCVNVMETSGNHLPN
ncbi:chitotriosidase-1-like [Phlebotomus argentipes]|uniref:chitotriosidase-1-like n=1 Tax=Phlebotomus argentipes TaxID=94469 RepID=UPI0028931AC5|nr:chitotriosidase-1-like [Phlebotomus argentipes]